jgi:hypothetical protein
MNRTPRCPRVVPQTRPNRWGCRGSCKSEWQSIVLRLSHRDESTHIRILTGLRTGVWCRVVLCGSYAFKGMGHPPRDRRVCVEQHRVWEVRDIPGLLEVPVGRHDEAACFEIPLDVGSQRVQSLPLDVEGAELDISFSLAHGAHD